MYLTGELLIGNSDVRSPDETIRAFNPTTERDIGPDFAVASPRDVDRAVQLADDALDEYGHAPLAVRAALLMSIARGLERATGELVDRLVLETGLPATQLEAEAAKAARQFRQFAQVAREGSLRHAAIDAAQRERQPSPRLDHRLQKIGIGPVVVFAASNFPIAYSVAGGDTAAALAAGCTVIVKAHNGHPGGSEIMARVIREAVENAGLPEGVFSMVRGLRTEVGEALVDHPLVKAVTFTGSEQGGMALYRRAQQRPEPIPVFSEMTSVNPSFVLPEALAARGAAIGTAVAEQMLAGVGQACLKPAIVLAVAGPGYDGLKDAMESRVAITPARPMLTRSICGSYRSGLARLEAAGAVRIAEGFPSSGSCDGQAALFEVDGPMFLSQRCLSEEVFGPTALLVRLASIEQMIEAARAFRGQLSIALHLEDTEQAFALQLLPILERRTGRLILNALSRPQEVGYATVHGGPFPATSDSRFTSVGMSSVERFLRPVCYQNFPAELLPRALRPDNPLDLWRLTDGRPSWR